jgi:hypothetical protein
MTNSIGIAEIHGVHCVYSYRNWGISHQLAHQYMTDNRTPREEPQHPDATGKGKKLYQKPTFRYERVFETLALSCGKIGSSTPNCQFSRKTS